MTRWAALFAAMMLAGCASAAVGSARVLKRGDQEAGFGIEIASGFAKRSPTRRAPFPWPYMSVGYRRGFGGGFELGGRLWGMTTPGLHTFGGAIESKIALRQIDPETRSVEAALQPSVGYHQINVGGAPAHVALTHLALLVGWNHGGGDQLVFGPRLDYQGLAGPDLHTVHIVMGGGVLGYNWQVTDVVAIRPHYVILWSPLSHDGTNDNPDRRGYTYMSLGIGGYVDWWNLKRRSARARGATARTERAVR